MSTPDLTPTQADALTDTRDPRTGLRYPPIGLQPYHRWLLDTLHRLAAHAASDYLVTPDTATPTSIHVAPGRASIGGTPLPHAGTTLELAALNNDTALVHLTDNAGSPELAASASAVGWPATPHIKLAEVTLAAGAITAITDRRFETILAA
ncbi:MAG: hypothetical protein AAF823_10475 [Planctomycetota bacterium]